LDEESMQRDSYLILCNKTDRSNEPSKLSMKAMVDFATYEMEYLKLVLECIMSSEDAEVSLVLMYRKLSLSIIDNFAIFGVIELSVFVEKIIDNSQ
jgi:hypothetical protein